MSGALATTSAASELAAAQDTQDSSPGAAGNPTDGGSSGEASDVPAEARAAAAGGRAPDVALPRARLRRWSAQWQAASIEAAAAAAA